MSKNLLKYCNSRRAVVTVNIKRNKAKKSISRFPRQHRENRYSLYRLISSLGIFIIIALALIIGVQYFQKLKIEQELAEYEFRLQEYEQRQADLKLEIERLQETDYIEALARERLGLVKPDEVIFQLED